MFSKNDREIKKLTKEIEKLEEKLSETEESRDYWMDCYHRVYEDKERAEDRIKTMKRIMENLAPHQLPTHEIPMDYFSTIIHGKAEAFTSAEELPYRAGDYFILKGIEEDKERTKLARIKKIDDFSLNYGFGYPKYNALGFDSRELCQRDLKFTYPEKTEKDIIYIYYIIVLA